MDTMVFSDLVGKTLTGVSDGSPDRLGFVLEDGSEWTMWHSQSYCETVQIEDITGDLSNLVGSPLIVAEERTDDNPAGRSFSEL